MLPLATIETRRLWAAAIIISTILFATEGIASVGMVFAPFTALDCGLRLAWAIARLRDCPANSS